MNKVRRLHALLRHAQVLLALTGLSCTAFGQTLNEAVLIALAQYPAISAAQSRVNSADAEIIRAQGAHWPQIVWQGTQSVYNAANVPNNWIQSPAVTMNVWSGWKIQSDVDRTRALHDASKHQQRITRDDVALLASEGYLNWAKNLELLKLAQSNHATHLKIYNDISKIVALDQGRRIDLEQAQVRLDNASLTLTQREAELAMSVERLNRMLLGNIPQYPSGIDRAYPLLPPSAERSLSEISDTHPVIAQQMAQVRAAQANVRSAQSQHSPTVNVAYGKQTYQGSGQGDYLAQVVVQIPIFSGGSTYGAVDSAAGQLEAARFALQEIRLVLREKILSGWAELISARTRSALGKKQTAASQSLLGGYIKQFQIGRRTLLDLLNAQSDLYNYQTATVTAEFDQRIAQARILAAIGKLAMASYDQETNSARKPISAPTNNSSTYVYTSK
jgi:adhesin transport system outer membrane protein